MAHFDDQALVAAARAEQARMEAALTRLQPGGSVRIDREHFRRLALLIDRLAARGAGMADRDGNAPVDGIRWWVPLPELERAQMALADIKADQNGSDLEPMMVRSLY